MNADSGQGDFAYAFDVAADKTLIFRLPGVAPGTVLVLHRQLYIARICEYTDPSGYGRFWDYERLYEAARAMIDYFVNPAIEEPVGWVRAVDYKGPGGNSRMRRGRLVDGAWEIRDTTAEERARYRTPQGHGWHE